MLRRFLVRKREAASQRWQQDCYVAEVLQGCNMRHLALRDRDRSRTCLRLWDLALDIFTLNGRI
ncbi:hypothetical protein [Leucobacter chromiiresistens]|uniref:Uncharacterized protein n=1 Tax=Leucobacter chromiiresistens TaxID=1079994 RepID=A0A1H0XQE2_9MICO|nr:hypothetical protein [Leucobacter chromiiresistens]SDQ05110.1 hypothetical protein SAMN04488565_0046 [Leucobacter chromiiresistens]